ncbi:MAG: toprim domain-containing protein, partial [Desulfovibrionaceae bacterium]|nr:toprim domain-containing protein [Desulfovibrionaceae bacterium]
ARYSDGHGYCHVCGWYEPGDNGHAGTRTTTGRRRMTTFTPLKTDIKPLKARGITAETCARFGYGIGRWQSELCHAAPLYDAEGVLVAQHLRLKNKAFRWVGDSSRATLFGQNVWRQGGRRVVVTEGEIDCMSISQLQGNKWPVTSLPNGAQSAEKYVRASLEWLEAFDEVVFAFDMDEPGQTAARACALLLTPGKARIARLPLKDANECLLADRGRELLDALWGAVPYRPDGIRSGAELWDDILKPPPAGYAVPYPELNARLHGLRPGELYLFTAGSGIGKSTIVNEIAYHLKMVHGLSLGIMALEENPARNARRYLSIHLNKPLHLPEVHAATPEADLRAAFEAVMAEGWWIYDHFGSSDIDTLLGKLRYMVVGLGCRVIVLDHISIVVSGLDEVGGESERKTIDRLMTRLRQLIEETGVMVLAVVHLKRPDKGKSYNEGRQVSLTDLRGSGSLEQVSDAVIAMERDQQDADAADTATLRVLKNRPLGDCGPAGTVTYHRDTGRLLACDAAGDRYGFDREETTDADNNEIPKEF